MDAFDIALSELGRTIGIDGLVFEDDSCQLEIGDALVDVLVARPRGCLTLATLVGELPDAGDARALGIVLDANCKPALDGASLGVPEGSGAVILASQHPAEGLDGRRLEAALEAFLAALDHARGVLARANAPEPAAPVPAPDAYMLRV